MICVPSLAAVNELSVTAEGSGTVSRANADAATISKAEISLRPDKRFILTLSGDERLSFRGTWEQPSDDRIVLTISQAFGAPASGDGVIILRRGVVARLGLTGADDVFTARFEARGRYTDFANPDNSREQVSAAEVRDPRTSRGRPAEISAVPPGRIRAPRPTAAPAPSQPPAAAASASVPLRATVRGEGTFQLVQNEDDEKAIEAMEVFLNADETVHLKMFGPGFAPTLAGSWRKTGPGPQGTTRYRLTIRSGFDAGRTNGSGTLLEKDGRVVALAVSGSSTALQSDWQLEFRQQ